MPEHPSQTIERLTPDEQAAVKTALQSARGLLSELSSAEALMTFAENQIATILIKQGQIVDCNQWVPEILGIERDQLLGQDLITFLQGYSRPHDPDKVREMQAQALAGTVQQFEMIYHDRGNIQRVIKVQLLPVKLPTGQTVVQLIASDVTEKRNMGLALRESEARYRDLFTTSRDGITLTDKDDYYIDCNPAFLAMLGYESVQELAGKTWLDITPKEYHQRELEGMSNLQSRRAEYEKEYLHKNGRRVLCLVRVWHRYDPNGRQDGGWAIVRDITHQRRLEEEVMNMERSRLLGELAAAIGHEIRNPLTTVRGFLQFLPSRSNYSDQDREVFKLMLHELDSAATIIRDFLDLARPEGPQVAPMALDELLRSLLRVMETKAIIQQIELSSEVTDCLLVAADSSQLRQVFVNLLQNAFQAMPNGGKLSLRTAVLSNQVIVTIADTGVGITPENLDRIGKPFFTTKPGGTGLGLATSFRIVAAHGGKITVSSELGQGTTFTVTLPLTS